MKQDKEALKQSAQMIESTDEEHVFDIDAFLNDVTYNALSNAARVANLDDYSFSDDFLEIISGSMEVARYRDDVFGECFLKDLSYGGCASGMVGSLIYYSQTKEIYIAHMDDIESFISDLESELGSINLDTPRYNNAVWLVFEEFSRNIQDSLDLHDELLDQLEDLPYNQKVDLFNYFADDYRDDIVEQITEDIHEMSVREKIDVFDRLVDCSSKEILAYKILDVFEEKEYTLEQLTTEFPQFSSKINELQISISDWLTSEVDNTVSLDSPTSELAVNNSHNRVTDDQKKKITLQEKGGNGLKV